MASPDVNSLAPTSSLSLFPVATVIHTFYNYSLLSLMKNDLYVDYGSQHNYANTKYINITTNTVQQPLTVCTKNTSGKKCPRSVCSIQHLSD